MGSTVTSCSLLHALSGVGRIMGTDVCPVVCVGDMMGVFVWLRSDVHTKKRAFWKGAGFHVS